MIELFDGMLLYHGSYTAIKDIDLAKCKKGLDFGQGFYLTSSYQQAVNYIPLAVKKAFRIHILGDDYKPDDGILSVYRFHYDPIYCIIVFELLIQNGFILLQPIEKQTYFQNC